MRTRLRKLSEREKRAVRLIWDGLTHKEASDVLGLARATVTEIVARLKGIYGCPTTPALFRALLLDGILQVETEVKIAQSD